MAAVTFDTLKFVERLKAAGVPEAQAKAEAEALALALSEAMESQLVTKIDLNRIERELLVIKWMTGLVLGGIVTLILKAFFRSWKGSHVAWAPLHVPTHYIYLNKPLPVSRARFFHGRSGLWPLQPA